MSSTKTPNFKEYGFWELSFLSQNVWMCLSNGSCFIIRNLSVFLKAGEGSLAYLLLQSATYFLNTMDFLNLEPDNFLLLVFSLLCQSVSRYAKYSKYILKVQFPHFQTFLLVAQWSKWSNRYTHNARYFGNIFQFSDIFFNYISKYVTSYYELISWPKGVFL